MQLSGKWDKMQQDFTKGVFCEANPVPSVSRGRFLNKEKEGDTAWLDLSQRLVHDFTEKCYRGWGDAAAWVRSWLKGDATE